MIKEMADIFTAEPGARVLDAGLRAAVRPLQKSTRPLSLNSPADSPEPRHSLRLGARLSRQQRALPWRLWTLKSHAVEVRRANVEGPPNRTNGLDTRTIPRRES